MSFFTGFGGLAMKQSLVNINIKPGGITHNIVREFKGLHARLPHHAHMRHLILGASSMTYALCSGMSVS